MTTIDYDAVLGALREQRAALDAAIQGIEKLLGTGVLPKKRTPSTGNSGRLWTQEDDAALRAFWIEGVRLRDIAVALNRTYEATVARRHKLDLPPQPRSPLGGRTEDP